MNITKTILFKKLRQSPLRSYLQPLWRKWHHQIQKKIFDKYAVDIIEEVFSLLNSEGIICWLDFGTLLGVYREHNFIAHDSDIDIGAYVEDVSRIETVLKKSMLQFDHKYIVGKDKIVAQISYGYKGVCILDINLYHKTSDNNQLYTYICYHPYNVNLPTNVVSVKKCYVPYKDFSSIFFKGIECTIPSNAAEYLSANYGKDFMTPDPNFDGSNAPNVIDCELDFSGIEIE